MGRKTMTNDKVELLSHKICGLKSSRTETVNEIVKLENRMRQINRIFAVLMAFGIGTLFGLLLAPLF